MNKLILKNAIGESYNLMESEVMTFLLDGLGFDEENIYMRAGSRYVLLDEVIDQKQLSFTALFHTNADAEFKKFMAFARKNPLTLLYGNDAGDYNIACRLSSLTKSDKKGFDKFACGITLTCLGFFYKMINVYNSGELGGGKMYDYTYDYSYSDDIAESITISSDARLESPMKLEIYGACTNPVWQHYLNGNLIETGKCNLTIPANRKLVIDTTEIPYSVTEQDMSGNIMADRYQLCDFETERFFLIRSGQNRITVSHDSVGIVPIKCEVRLEYEAV